jgi:hypothetical protein
VEDLRDRLGLDPREPINIDQLRHNKMMHINQDRALNRVLNKEVCPCASLCEIFNNWRIPSFLICCLTVYSKIHVTIDLNELLGLTILHTILKSH